MHTHPSIVMCLLHRDSSQDTPPHHHNIMRVNLQSATGPPDVTDDSTGIPVYVICTVFICTQACMFNSNKSFYTQCLKKSAIKPGTMEIMSKCVLQLLITGK